MAPITSNPKVTAVEVREGSDLSDPEKSLPSSGQITPILPASKKDIRPSRKPLSQATLDYYLHNTTPSSDSKYLIVQFAKDDPEHPFNWSSIKKTFVTAAVIITLINSNSVSSIPSNATPFMAKEFNITSQTQMILPITMYLFGYVLGHTTLTPLSEEYNRRVINLVSFSLFTIFLLLSAFSTSWTAFLVFRFFTGAGAAPPISVSAGQLSDVFGDMRVRGIIMAVMTATTSLGPVMGPIISGFLAPIEWRWAYRASLIICAATWPLVLWCPETYEPSLLRKRARKMRAATGMENIVAPSELVPHSFRKLLTRAVTRPTRLFLFEPIVTLSCVYLAYGFSILYLWFEAYPIIFEGVYGMTPGSSGLMLLPIGLGAGPTCVVYVLTDNYMQRLMKRRPDLPRSLRRLSLACLGAPMFSVSLFWLGWTAYKSIPWCIPMLAGLIFGVSYQLMFTALTNYIADQYGNQTASVMAASAITRSILGGVFPLVGKPMYDRLGIHWATSVLGFASVVLIFVPYAFLYWGDKMKRSGPVADARR